MKIRSRLFLLFAIVAAALWVVAVPARAAGGSVDPPRGGPGVTLTFTADGYTPREELAAWANTPSGTVVAVPVKAQATAAGIMTWRWKVPADAAGGVWRMVGTGMSSQHQVVIPVTVDAPVATPTPVPTASGVSPESGVPGTTFRFAAAGFGSREELSYWVTQPNGVSLVNNTKAKSDKSGRVEFAWDAPATVFYGRWTMTIFSRGTSRSVRIPFSIVPPASEQAPEASVSPAVGKPEDSFTFTAGGFAPRADLRRWATAPDGSSGSDNVEFNADDSGRTVFVWKAPANALAGDWIMTVQSLDNTVSRRIAFRITRDAPPAAEGVTPAEGRAGDSLTFFVSGLPPQMLLDYWAIDPNGTGEPVPHQVRADTTGRAEWRWTIPPGAVPGAWRMSVRRAQEDRSGGAYVQRQIFFTVR